MPDLPFPFRPSELLSPRREIVPWDEEFRQTEMRELLSWAATVQRFWVVALTGVAGSGKTRLLIECCHRLRAADWHAGFLPDAIAERGSDHRSEARGLLERRKPLFLVIDNAASRPELVEFLFQLFAESTNWDGSKIRVVMIDRHLSGWYTHVLEGNPVVEFQTRFFRPIQLTDIPVAGETRLRLLRSAIEAFRRVCEPASPPPNENRFLRFAKQLLTRESATAQPVPDQALVSDPLFGQVLTLQMAALAIVKGVPATPDRLVASLADCEIEACSVPPGDRARLGARALVTTDAAVLRIVAAFGLLGGVSRLERARALCAASLLPALPSVLAQTCCLARLEAEGEPSERRLGRIDAELLADKLVQMALQHEQTPGRYVSELTAGASPVALRNMFATLFRCSSQPGLDCQTPIRQLLEVDFETRIEAAVWALRGLGGGYVVHLVAIDRLLATICRERGSHAVAKRLGVALEDCHETLAHLSLWIAERRLEEVGDPAQPEFGALLRRASLLRDLGWCWLRLEAFDKARETLAEAAQIARQAVAKAPLARDDFAPQVCLCDCLSGLQDSLCASARWPEARSVVAELVSTARVLAESQPEAFEDRLLSALGRAASVESELGHHAESLTFATEALEIHRRVAEKTSDPRGELSWSLNAFASALESLDRWNEALPVRQEAAKHLRALSTIRPVLLADLGIQLRLLSRTLNLTDQADQALATARESATIARQVFQPHSQERWDELFRINEWLSSLVRKAGDHREALRLTDELVELARQRESGNFSRSFSSNAPPRGRFVIQRKGVSSESFGDQSGEQLPDRSEGEPRTSYLPTLGSLLIEAASDHHALQSYEQGLRAINEAIEIFEQLEQATQGAGFIIPQLTEAMRVKAQLEESRGRSAAAKQLLSKAATLQRQVAGRTSFEDPMGLVRILWQQAMTHSNANQVAEALEQGQQALAILRAKQEKQPDLSTLSACAMVNNSLSIWLFQLGRHEEAAAAGREACGFYRTHWRERPHEFVAFFENGVANLRAPLLELSRHAELAGWTQELIAALRSVPLASSRDQQLQVCPYLEDVGNLLRTAGRPAEAVEVEQELVSVYRSLAAHDPKNFRIILATRLNSVGVWLAELGRTAEALPVSTEAVTLLRGNVNSSQPDGQFVLLIAVRNLGSRLAELNRHEEALPMFREAVVLGRQFSQRNLDQHGGQLWLSLQALQESLSRCNRFPESLEACREMLALGRSLAALGSLGNREMLVLALQELGNKLLTSGQTTEAVSLVQEGVAHGRSLIVDDPRTAKHQAHSLQLLSQALVEDNRPADAVAALGEAIPLLRQLATNNPATHQGSLADALFRLSRLHLSQNEFTQALPLIDEATANYRELEAQRHDPASEWLWRSLFARFEIMQGLNRGDEALAAVEEASGQMREYCRIGEEVTNCGLMLGYARMKAAELLAERGRTDEALAAAAESVKILRSDSVSHSPLTTGILTESILQHAILLINADRRSEALPLTEEALERARKAFRDDPEVGRNLSVTLGCKADCELALGRPDAALQALLEQRSLLQRLSDRDPNQHLFRTAQNREMTATAQLLLNQPGIAAENLRDAANTLLTIAESKPDWDAADLRRVADALRETLAANAGDTESLAVLEKVDRCLAGRPCPSPPQ